MSRVAAFLVIFFAVVLALASPAVATAIEKRNLITDLEAVLKHIDDMIMSGQTTIAGVIALLPTLISVGASLLKAKLANTLPALDVLVDVVAKILTVTVKFVGPIEGGLVSVVHLFNQIIQTLAHVTEQEVTNVCEMISPLVGPGVMQHISICN